MTILKSLAGASAGWEKKVLHAGVEERFGDPIPSSDRCLLQFIWTAVFLSRSEPLHPLRLPVPRRCYSRSTSSRQFLPVVSIPFEISPIVFRDPPPVASQDGDTEEPKDQDVDLQEDRKGAALLREGGGEGGGQDC